MTQIANIARKTNKQTENIVKTLENNANAFKDNVKNAISVFSQNKNQLLKIRSNHIGKMKKNDESSSH